MKTFKKTSDMVEWWAKKRHIGNLTSGGCFIKGICPEMEKMGYEFSPCEGGNNFYRYSLLQQEIARANKRVKKDPITKKEVIYGDDRRIIAQVIK